MGNSFFQVVLSITEAAMLLHIKHVGNTMWSPDCPSPLLSALGPGPLDRGSGGFLVLFCLVFLWF